jgi:hypothetical protein
LLLIDAKAMGDWQRCQEKNLGAVIFDFAQRIEGNRQRTQPNELFCNVILYRRAFTKSGRQQTIQRMKNACGIPATLAFASARCCQQAVVSLLRR